MYFEPEPVGAGSGIWYLGVGAGSGCSSFQPAPHPCMFLAKLNLQDESNMYTNMKIALKDFNIEIQSIFYQKFNKSAKLMFRFKSKCNKKNQRCKFEHPEDSKEETKNSKCSKNGPQKKAKESKPK